MPPNPYILGHFSLSYAGIVRVIFGAYFGNPPWVEGKDEKMTTIVTPEEIQVTLVGVKAALFGLDGDILATGAVLHDEDLAFLSGMLSVVTEGVDAMLDYLGYVGAGRPQGTPKVRPLFPRPGRTLPGGTDK